MKNNIILIGMPGVGKTTIGKHLSSMKECLFYDTDHLLANFLNMSLQNYINEFGNSKFQEQEEYNLLNNLDNINNSIISTGGSVVYLENGMKKLKEIGFIVYLQNTFPVIEKRLSLSKNRGIIIKENQTLLDLYNERVSLYEKYSEITINCHNKSIYDIINEINNKPIKHVKFY